MPSKELFSTSAILLTFIAYYPYLRGVLRDEIAPHLFSWIIWGVTTFVVFFAQLKDHGGAGAWPIGFSGAVTFLVAFLAYQKRSKIEATRVDWLFLLSALSSLPFWYMTNDPLWAVAILTTVDTLGFGPTIRKTYHFPHSEPMDFYALFALRNLLAIFALENYSATTLLFPVVTGVACLLLVFMVLLRRRRIRPA